MPVPEPDILAYYTRPEVMTAMGRYAPLVEPLPRDIAGLAAVGQGLIVHEHMAEQGYGVPLTEADRASVHTRPVERILAQIVARDDRPLGIAREPAGRLPGNCRHFTVLMTALLRAQGTPARARCGFGAYFGGDMFEDHWVGEYWNAGQGRWALVDAQIDARQLGWFPIDFDVTDVPRDRFLVAGQAWASYRAGQADPDKFGLSVINESGDWWIAANLMRDAAALLNIELLPWDVWGAMPGPADPIGEDLATLFDRLAKLTQEPDGTLAELRQLMHDDDRLRVPPTVLNAVRERQEPVG
ncbi:MAG: transglutaminase-like domain-containing protein [Streptosporangiaceae bacterium]